MVNRLIVWSAILPTDIINFKITTILPSLKFFDKKSQVESLLLIKCTQRNTTQARAKEQKCMYHIYVIY